jgi:hypothetical protein
MEERWITGLGELRCELRVEWAMVGRRIKLAGGGCVDVDVGSWICAEGWQDGKKCRFDFWVFVIMSSSRGLMDPSKPAILGTVRKAKKWEAVKHNRKVIKRIQVRSLGVDRCVGLMLPARSSCC